MSRSILPDTIIGHYRIVSKLGAGGMGEVYLAQDTKLDRKVAIKFLHEEFSKDADKLGRFIQEAKAASALNHPNILTVHEIGEVDGKDYIATELIDGQTLRDHLSHKALQLNTILKIGVQVAEALSAAHQAGIIHRDIKPENIMLRKDGYAKVLDFGLAKLSGPVATGSTSSEDATRAFVKTNPGMVMGTVSYMSPEQARGKETDARTDTWSLGVVLYEMLSGKVPFTGETINHTIVSILEKEPLLLENVPAELQRIVRKAMTKDVEMRYQSARDLLIDLKSLRRDLDIQGELERSIVPHRETTNASLESATQMYPADVVAATRSGQAAATQSVTTSSSSLEYAVTQAKSHKLATALIGVVLLAVISIVGYFALVSRGSSSTKQISSIAVMPFVNESGNADIEYLSDGMTETLINSLSQVPNLNVKARSSVFRYKGKEPDPKKIGEELNVQAILTGRVVQRGDQLTLNLELIDAQTENTLWGNRYERKPSELVALQSEVARDVSTRLTSRLSGADVAKVEKNYTANPEAYQLYLKGKFYWNKRTGGFLKQAADFYQQAIEKDPNYALAFSGLAETYVLFSSYDVASAVDSMPQAKAAAQRALAIDDSLAEAHTALAFYLANYEWDRVGAEREYRRAIELNSNYATAHHWLGADLSNLKRFDESIAEMKRAEELDPLSPIIGTNLGDMLVLARRYDEAIAQFKRVLIRNPDFEYAYLALSRAYGSKGMYPEAIAEAHKALKLNYGSSTKGYLGLWLARSGRRDEALKLLSELKEEAKQNYVQGDGIGLIYLGLGDKEEALNWLEKHMATRAETANAYGVLPQLDELRSEPRFKAMLKRMNLPD